MTIDDLYHFSDINPAIRYFCKLNGTRITKTFIDRAIKSRPPTVHGRQWVRLLSPALGAFLRRLCLQSVYPASPPFRSLFLLRQSFPIALDKAYNMALSLERRTKCNKAIFAERVNTFIPGVILLGEFFEQYRAKIASFVMDPANAIYFSNASPGIADRRSKNVQLQRNILTNRYRFPAVHLLQATYLFLIDLFTYEVPFAHWVGSSSTHHEILLFGGLETVIEAIRYQHLRNRRARLDLVASRLCRAGSGTLLTDRSAVPVPAKEFVPVLDAPTVAKMKRMVRGVKRFPCGSNGVRFGLTIARPAWCNQVIRRDSRRFAAATD